MPHHSPRFPIAALSLLYLCAFSACTTGYTANRMRPRLNLPVASVASVAGVELPADPQNRDRGTDDDQESGRKRNPRRRVRVRNRWTTRPRRPATPATPATPWPEFEEDGWRRGNPRFYWLVSGGTGDLEYWDDVDGLSKVDATLHRFQMGGSNRRGRGMGVDLRLLTPRDDLYAENEAIRSDLEQLDIHAFFSNHVSAGPLRLEVRVGPYLNRIRRKRVGGEFGSGYRSTHDSIGIRGVLAPEVVLLQSDDLDICLRGLAAAGAHVTFIDDESYSEERESTGSTIDLELGVRFRLGTINLSSGFVYHRVTNEASDEESSGSIPGIETEFSGFQVTVGMRF